MTIEESKYICPNCGEEQTSVIEVQDISIYSEFNLKTGDSERTDETDQADHRDWQCPGCGESVQDELGDEITRCLWGN